MGSNGQLGGARHDWELVPKAIERIEAGDSLGAIAIALIALEARLGSLESTVGNLLDQLDTTLGNIDID